MPSLKDLRNRIASVKATQKITKAMQMVAAAKLRRAQEAAEAARPYSQRMGAVLANIAEAVGKAEPERAACAVEGHRLPVGLERPLPGAKAIEHDPAEEVPLRIPGRLAQHRIPLGERLIPELAIGQVASQDTMVAAGPALVVEHAGDEGKGAERE